MDNTDLNRERKVKNRKSKVATRLGNVLPKDSVNSVEENSEEIRKYLNEIICGNSLKILPLIPDNSIDIIITSPPYNFGLDYDGVKDAVFWDKYFEDLNNVWIECDRVLKPGGRICVNIQPLFSDYIPSHHIISNQLRKIGLLWKAEILWEKNNYNCKYTAWGSWKSPSMPYFKYTWEFIEVFCKVSYKKTGSKDDIDITGDEFKEWVYSKWSIAPESNMKKFNHPAVFPEALVERLLKLFSYKSDTVLDPFNGVGTTTAVAKRLGRNYIGIDISEEYCNTARQRTEQKVTS